MKLQNLTVIFIIIALPVILIISLYISTGLKTIEYQSLYDTGLINATHDAIYALEINSSNDEYAGNPEIKRDILKSSVKMFEKSLCNTCGISSYNTDEIEEYIPAIVFGMYDGFYLYAPSKMYNEETGGYEYTHNLRNYVYYSETLKGIGKNSSDVVIIYSLDNYVTVSGDFGDGYELKAGYLIDLNGSESNGNKYKGIGIDTSDTDAINYYKEAYTFTTWFNLKIGDKVKDANNKKYLYIDSENDPEDEDSLFVQHKKSVMKEKIEGVLNSTITAYANRIGSYNFKMPKLSEEDWQKIYSNISMITFFQGKNIGLTKYNGYCVLNSTNSNEYVNSNLMYFIDGTDDTNHYYHDIRCSVLKNSTQTITGYKIGAFNKEKLDEPDANGNYYKYNHNALACYECVNASINTNQSVFDYVRRDGSASSNIQTAYWTSLARERYNQVKLLETSRVIVTYVQEGREIYGKDVSGNVVITLKLGDVIKYDCTNGGNTYSYTSEEEKNGYSDQTFSTNSNIQWKAIGAENGKLIISANCQRTTSNNAYWLKGVDSYDYAVDELNKICQIYGNGYGAASVRSIQVNDIKKIWKEFGFDIEADIALRNYGNGTELYDLRFTSNSTCSKNWIGNEYVNCDEIGFMKLIRENGAYWFANSYHITNSHSLGGYTMYAGHKGMYATHSSNNEFYAFWGQHLNDSQAIDTGKNRYVKPVVYLKSNVQLYETADGIWNIR